MQSDSFDSDFHQKNKSLTTSILDAIREFLGTPVKLRQLLATRPDACVQIAEPDPTIASSSVVPWHRWGEPSVFRWPRRAAGQVVGWSSSTGNTETNLPALANFGEQRVVTLWTCEIQDVQGLSNSKSNLFAFKTLDEFIERDSPNLIDTISATNLHENLAHNEIRIIHHDKTSDHFARYLWDGRVLLMNDGGSHHFAAARYIAARIRQQVPLRGRLYTYAINEGSVDDLRRDYELFLIPDEPAIANAFHDVMRSLKATYFWHEMPRAHDKTKAILLPRKEARSMRVAHELRKAGLFDLGQYLGHLCQRQNDPGHSVPEQ